MVQEKPYTEPLTLDLTSPLEVALVRKALREYQNRIVREAANHPGLTAEGFDNVAALSAVANRITDRINRAVGQRHTQG